MKRRALILGCTGQDGSYLAELLLSKDYEVYGLVRRTSTNGTWRIQHLLDSIHLLPGDLTDQGSLQRALKLAEPHEVYNFAAQSFVAHSFEAPVYTADVTGLGALKLFEAVRQVCSSAKVYQASSSEMFGNAEHSPQSELTPFQPVSPYGAAKVLAHTAAQIYRNAYHLFISTGIAYNHESPRRGEEFVTRKITQAVAQIKLGQQDTLFLGNTTSRRDWGHALDVVRGAWLTLQADHPSDYIFATGQTYSVLEFVEMAFNYVGLDTQKYLKQDLRLMRPTEVHLLCGNAEKAWLQLGWKPTITIAQLVHEMVEEDLSRANALHCHPLTIP